MRNSAKTRTHPLPQAGTRELEGNPDELSQSSLEGQHPQLSIVVPAFNEASNLGKLFEELSKVLPRLGMPWEIIFVDDGSKDATWAQIRTLSQSDPRVRGLQFSRNFGHQYAVFAGLSSARGAAVICMDADLQHPSELIPELISEWQKGNKIVNTIRVDAAELPFMKKLTSRMFYTVFSFLSGVRLEPGMADFRLFDRQALGNGCTIR